MKNRTKTLTLLSLTLCIMLTTACSTTTTSTSSKEENPQTEQNQQTVETVKNEKNTAEEHTLETGEPATMTKEETLLSIFDSKLEDQEKVTELVKNLEGIDFSKLDQAQEGKGIEILDYLVKHTDLITTDNYKALFLGSTSLDGALSESYASIVGHLFTKDKEAVLITLSSIDDEAIKDQVISFIGYNLSYTEFTKVKKELEEFKETTKLGETEKSMVDAIIKKVENPY